MNSNSIFVDIILLKDQAKCSYPTSNVFDIYSDKEMSKKKPDRGREAKKTTDNQNDSSDEDDSNQGGECIFLYFQIDKSIDCCIVFQRLSELSTSSFVGQMISIFTDSPQLSSLEHFSPPAPIGLCATFSCVCAQSNRKEILRRIFCRESTER